MSTPYTVPERVPTTFVADPGSVVSTLRTEWEVFQEQRTVGQHIRPVIARSWSRSLELGVSPDRRAADVDGAALRGFESRAQIRRLFGLSSDPVTRELADELHGSNSAIVVCDDHGVIVDRRGDPSILRLTERQNFVQGASWNEQCAGTNGIGLALELGRPAQVFSAEHFCVGFQDYACTAAPVHHPVTREVIGVLDVTTKCEELTYHTYAMVVHAARDIERQLEEHVFGRERELLERYLRGRVGLQMPFITVDRSGRTIIQNALAAERLSASDDLPAVLHIVRQALTESSDLSRDLELSIGRSTVRAHLVRADGEVIGAVVAVEPLRTRRPAQEKPLGWQPLEGKSSAMRQLTARAERIAIACIPAIIEGEPGTGKRALAEAMHARSPRRDEPLAVVNFATKNWRADWEVALRNAGTIILRRLTALSETQQLDIAEAVEAVRARDRSPWLISIMTTADHPLRLELLHRLGPSSLVIPPLRERIDDIGLIVQAWALREAGAGPGARPLRVSDEALIALRSHEWPGNVRELLNTLASASLQTSGPVIRPDDLDIAAPASHARSAQPYSAIDLRDVERNAIEHALSQTGGNVSRAADLLGISRSTLHRRLQTYRLIGR